MKRPVLVLVLPILALAFGLAGAAAVSAQEGAATPAATYSMSPTPSGDGAQTGTPEDAATPPASVPDTGSGPASGGISVLLLLAVGAFGLAGGSLVVASYRRRS